MYVVRFYCKTLYPNYNAVFLLRLREKNVPAAMSAIITMIEITIRRSLLLGGGRLEIELDEEMLVLVALDGLLLFWITIVIFVGQLDGEEQCISEKIAGSML